MNWGKIQLKNLFWHHFKLGQKLGQCNGDLCSWFGWPPNQTMHIYHYMIHLFENPWPRTMQWWPLQLIWVTSKPNNAYLPLHDIPFWKDSHSTEVMSFILLFSEVTSTRDDPFPINWSNLQTIQNQVVNYHDSNMFCSYI